MPYRTPAEILKTNRSIQTDIDSSPIVKGGLKRDTEWLKAILKQDDLDAKAKAALLKAQLEEDDSGGGSLWDKVKGIAGSALNTIDLGRATVMALGAEGMDALSAVTGGESRIQNTDKVRQTGVSWEDIMHNIRHHVTMKDLLEADTATEDLPGPVNSVLGLAGDIAADPLTRVGFGKSLLNRSTLTQVGRVAGEDVAEAVARRGVAAGDAVLAERAGAEGAERLAKFEAGQLAEAARRERFLPKPSTATGLDESLLNMSGKGGQPSLFGALDQPVETALAERIRPLVANPLPEMPTALTIRDILGERLAQGAPTGDLNTLLNKQLASLEGKGGLKFAGYETGIGQQAGEKLLGAIRASGPSQGIRNLFVPTAEVADTLGRGAAESVDSALHAGGTEYRRARQALADTVADGAPDPDVYKQALTQGKQAMANDLLKYGGDTVASRTAKEGWSEFADGVYVPDVVAKTLKRGFGKPPSEVLSNYDKIMGWAKSHITLNPILNPTGVPRNMFGNMIFATVYGGATNPKLWEESYKLRNALIKYAESEGDEMSEAGFKAWANANKVGLNETSLRRGWLLHEQGVAGRGGMAFDDVAESSNLGKGPRGTRTTAKALEAHEELARGAVFLKALDDGLTASEALKRSADAMLDYSSVGLTPFERDVMQRLTLFYKFPRRAIPQGLEFMAREPGQAIALTRAGLGVAKGTRNEYGDAIGGYWDTPLEATVRPFASVLSNKDGPLLGTADEFGAPWVNALLNNGSNARSIEQLFPVLDSTNRAKEKGGAGWLEKASVAPGRKNGVDYKRTRADAYLNEKVALLTEEGKTIDGLEAIRLYARDVAGIEQAASMSAPDLVSLLLDRGVAPLTVGQILLGPPREKAPPKPAPDYSL